MLEQSNKSGKIEYMDHVLEWSPEGLTISATDYHSGPLSIPWKLVLILLVLPVSSETPLGVNRVYANSSNSTPRLKGRNVHYSLAIYSV